MRDLSEPLTQEELVEWGQQRRYATARIKDKLFKVGSWAVGLIALGGTVGGIWVAVANHQGHVYGVYDATGATNTARDALIRRAGNRTGIFTSVVAHKIHFLGRKGWNVVFTSDEGKKVCVYVVDSFREHGTVVKENCKT